MCSAAILRQAYGDLQKLDSGTAWTETDIINQELDVLRTWDNARVWQDVFGDHAAYGVVAAVGGADTTDAMPDSDGAECVAGCVAGDGGGGRVGGAHAPCYAART
jgi:hypothetical protein